MPALNEIRPVKERHEREEILLDLMNHLFTPIKVGNLTLKNRLIHTSMAPGPGYALPGGKPSQRLINYLEERAKGGVALLCTSVGFYESDLTSEHYTAAYRDEHIPDLKKVAEAVHKHGGADCRATDNHSDLEANP